MEASKACSKCKDVKPLNQDNFRRQGSTKDGFKYVCRQCDDEVQKRRYNSKKSHYLSKVKEWQVNHPDKVKSYKNKHRAKQSTEQ